MTERTKRGDHIPPPPADDEWDLRYATKESLAFAEMEKLFPGTAAEAKARLRTKPDGRSDVQKPLRGSLGTRVIGGRVLPQWQYDISSAARLWYCVDAERRTVWLTLAATGHPRATTARNRRAPSHR